MSKRSKLAVSGIVGAISVVAFAAVGYAATGGSLTVTENIVGGTANSSNFIVTLKTQSGTSAVSISASGGTILFSTLTPGQYTLTVQGPAGYTTTWGSRCAGGNVTITAGSSVSCTLTETFGNTGTGGTGSTGGTDGRIRIIMPPRLNR